MKKKEKPKKKRKAGRVVLTVILIICIVVFCVSAYQLYKIMSNYHKSNEEYDVVQQEVVEETDDGFFVDFDKLQAQNPDCIGWIRFENLDISYPIMKGTDNEYYLHHTINGSYLYAGSIFMNYQNASDFSDMNTFIFGHNMKNDSMFGLLGDFKDKEVYEKNPCFWIYTPEGAHRYDIFSCYVADADEDTYTVYHGQGEAYDKYVKQLKENSAYPIDVDVDGTDKIVTLSTCTEEGYDYRYIVNGVLAETIPADEQ